MSNAYTNTRIEYHILQSFPVTCLNRDDVGAPKTALVGGVTRARVSSQCWKRQVRLAMKALGLPMGTRTKLIGLLIACKCKELGASDEQAEACGQVIEKIFIKEDKKAKGKKKDQEVEETEASDDDNDTLLFLSPHEVEIIATAFQKEGFVATAVITQKDQKKQAAELTKLIGKPEEAVNAVDIALFGRMVAKAAEMNVEAAASFAHAISTHRVSNEVEFFTAVADAVGDVQPELGAAHMGSLEFNSATYYRYISLDLGQLAQTLGEEDLKKVVAAFTQALFVAVPSARQATQSGASPWEFARVLVRKGQRLQVPFETPVQKGREGGYLQPSIEALKGYLDKKEKLTGSLFGKLGSYDWGEDENFSIDDLIAKLQSHVQ